MSKLQADEADFPERRLREYLFPELRFEPFYGRNSKKLRNYTPETWRYRIGKFRLFCVADPKEKIICSQKTCVRTDAEIMVQQKQHCTRVAEIQVTQSADSVRRVAGL